MPHRLSALELSIAIGCALSLIFFPPSLVVLMPTLIGVVLWKGYRAGRPARPRFCARCGYVIEKLKGTRCPECGMGFLNPEAERERALRARANEKSP